MFTINLEDGREAPSKARKKGAKRLEFLVYIYLSCFLVCLKFEFNKLQTGSTFILNSIFCVGHDMAQIGPSNILPCYTLPG